MPLSRRYSPEHPPAEACLFGYDFSPIIPPGLAVTIGEVTIFHNDALAQPADADWVVGPVQIVDRTVYAQLNGGIEGKDYQVRWMAIDTAGNVWRRTGLILCAQTS